MERDVLCKVPTSAAVDHVRWLLAVLHQPKSLLLNVNVTSLLTEEDTGFDEFHLSPVVITVS